MQKIQSLVYLYLRYISKVSSPTLAKFQILTANVSCDCLTGPRDCFSNETSSAAVIGGLTPIDNPVDQVEVIGEDGAGKDDLLPDLPDEASRRWENTLIILYKGCMNFKTRGNPYFFQNFDSFYPLFHPLFFQKFL